MSSAEDYEADISDNWSKVHKEFLSMAEAIPSMPSTERVMAVTALISAMIRTSCFLQIAAIQLVRGEDGDIEEAQQFVASAMDAAMQINLAKALHDAPAASQLQ